MATSKNKRLVVKRGILGPTSGTIGNVTISGNVIKIAKEIKKKSCNESCSPGDYRIGGKCYINGCYLMQKTETRQ